MIKYSKENGIGFITLNRPDKRNALHPDLVKSLKEKLSEAADDASIKVLIITGEGKSFCAGADLAYLKDLEGFSHIIVLYRFHLVSRVSLRVTPFLDTEPHGVFATRAPTRPNPIGLSVLALTGIRANLLEVKNVDMLDGTPLLDIKPYVPEFDTPAEVRSGWLGKAKGQSKTHRSDQRFS